MMDVGEFFRALLALWLTEMLWFAWMIRDVWFPQVARRFIGK